MDLLERAKAEFPGTTVIRQGNFFKIRGTGYELFIDGHALAGDQDARLARGAKVRGQAPTFQFFVDGECGVFLAAGTVGADGEQTPAAAAREREIFRR